MSKVLLLGDLHLGTKNGNIHFAEYFNKFFTDILYPYMTKHKIKHVIQLGDTFDGRVHLNIRAFSKSKETWFGQLAKDKITMHMLLGNHDLFRRHSVDVNSPEAFLCEYTNINIINKPTVIDIDGTKFDVIPWKCDSNADEIDEFIARKDKSEYLCGHLELGGFPMYKGEQCYDKIPTTFDDYTMVFSGHYHTKSKKGNIIYTGIPYEITWSDCDDPKGFHVLDTKTKKLEFVQNPNILYHKIKYNNGCDVDITILSGKLVKVIVLEKSDPVAFDRFIDSIKLVTPYALDIIENITVTNIMDIDKNVSIDDTRTIIEQYIDQIDTTVDKASLKKYILDLHSTASMLDD